MRGPATSLQPWRIARGARR